MIAIGRVPTTTPRSIVIHLFYCHLDRSLSEMLSSAARVKRYLAIVGVDPFVGDGFEATGAEIFDLRLIHVPPVQGSFVIRFSTLHVLGEVVPLVFRRSDNLLRIERYTYTHTRFLLYEQAFDTIYQV